MYVGTKERSDHHPVHLSIYLLTYLPTYSGGHMPFSVPPTPSSPPSSMMTQYVPKGIDPHVQRKMEGWNIALIASGQGLLFENDTLQVGR